MSRQIVVSTCLAITSLLSPTLAEHITAAVDVGVLLPRQNSDPGSTSCDPWLSIESSCAVATSQFVSLDFTVQASCLCYSGSVWQPSTFDNEFDTCLQHLSTASPSEYSVLGGNSLPTNPCALAGNVVAITESATSSETIRSTATGLSASAPVPNPTVTSSSDPNDIACSSWDAIQLSCSSAIPSFTALPFSSEASCLCYQSSTYAGNLYDDLWGSCLDYFKTASPVLYSSTLGGDTVLRTPCGAEIGNTATTPVGSVISSAIISNSVGSGATPTAPGSSVVRTSMALTTTEPTGTTSNGSLVAIWGRSAVIVHVGLLLLLFIG